MFCFKCDSCGNKVEQLDRQPSPFCDCEGTPMMKRDYRAEATKPHYHPTRDLYWESKKRRMNK